MLAYFLTHLGVIGTALLAFAVGYWALKTWTGKAVLALMIVFFMINDRLFSSSDLPIGGPVGNVIQVGQFGSTAQSDHAICLAKKVNAEVPGNAPLDAATRACTVVQTQTVQQCMNAPANVLVADKLVYCQGQAEPAWSQCVQQALIGNSRDGPASVSGCNQNYVVGLMRQVAGLFSFAKWWPAKTVTYNAECLRTAFNNNYKQLPDLHCGTLLNDAAKLQACIIQSLTQAFGAQGTALVARCEVK